MVQVVLGISFLIFVHELGHFIVARYYGVRCDIFSIGFGPSIVSYKPGETEYRLAWIPLGGYVMMLGSDLSQPPTGAPDEIHSKSIFARFVIYLAGVAMNLFFAVVLFSIAFNIGVQFVAPEVGSVVPGSPAWNAGLLPGDVVVKLDDAEIIDFEQIRLNIAFADNQTGVELTVIRNGETIKRRIKPVYREAQGVQWIGIQPAAQEVIQVTRDGPAWKAGLRNGDRLLRVHTSRDVDTNIKLIEALRAVEGRTFEVEYERDGDRKTVKIEAPASEAYLLGVMPGSAEIAYVRERDPKDGKTESAARRVKLQVGDAIRSIGDVPVRSLRAARVLVDPWPEKLGKSAEMIVRRGDKDVALVLPMADGKAVFDDVSAKSGGATIGGVVKGSAAETAGITTGSTITEMGGVAISTWSDLPTQVGKTKGKEVSVKWIDSDNVKQEAKIAPAKVDKLAGTVGFAFDMKLTPEVEYGFADACRVGAQHSKEMSIKVVLMLKALFTRKVSATNLGGPILIAQASYAYVDRFGFGRFLYFLGLLSVNLVVLNLLPVPGLDGGHLMFLGIEGVKGSPLSQTTMNVTLTIGFFMILALIVFVVFNDILRLLQWGG